MFELHIFNNNKKTYLNESVLGRSDRVREVLWARRPILETPTLTLQVMMT